ncbi:hypothetical protein AADZ90_007895 [Aestuariibius sp. 2305UL40-4]|uniref:hypothetical protein n=1 Tax=Aestuariibius violaceus TaxID=3234132 RepID=UPI00345EFE50
MILRFFRPAKNLKVIRSTSVYLIGDECYIPVHGETTRGLPVVTGPVLQSSIVDERRLGETALEAIGLFRYNVDLDKDLQKVSPLVSAARKKNWTEFVKATSKYASVVQIENNITVHPSKKVGTKGYDGCGESIMGSEEPKELGEAIIKALELSQ